jgi:hypothetical protein
VKKPKELDEKQMRLLLEFATSCGIRIPDPEPFNELPTTVLARLHSTAVHNVNTVPGWERKMRLFREQMRKVTKKADIQAEFKNLHEVGLPLDFYSFSLDRSGATAT